MSALEKELFTPESYFTGDLSDPMLLSDPGAVERLADFVGEMIERSTIVDLDYLGSVPKDNGTLHRYGLITEAGYTHAANVAIPNELGSDIPVLYTAAWTTSSRGLNEKTADELMGAGLASLHVANEGSYHPSLVPSIPSRGLTLAGTAGAALEFSREIVPAEYKYILDPRLRTAIGESKGGMEGMGTVSVLSNFFDQEMLMADFTAPCIPRRPSAMELVSFLDQPVRKEPVGTAKLAGRIAVDGLVRMPSTIDLHPYARAHQVAKGAAVLSGETGDLARLIDRNFNLHITQFNEDGWSMDDTWEEIFKDFPNVRITKLAGNHLTIADPETRAFITARQIAFRDLYEANGRRQYDDDGKQLFSGDDIWDLAHDYYERYKTNLPGGVVQSVIRLALNANNRLFGGKPQPKAA